MPREDCERLRAIFVYAKTGKILYDAKELTYQAATAQGPPNPYSSTSRTLDR